MSSDREFDAYANEYLDAHALPPATPDEPIIYRGHLTEAEIAEALGELQEQGYVRTEAAYPGCAKQWIPTGRPVRHVPVDEPVTLFAQTIIDRLLTTIDRLGAATIIYETASQVLADADIAARAARQEHEDLLVALTDGLYMLEKVRGTNEKMRDASLKAQLAEDRRTYNSAKAVSAANVALTQAEARFREADQSQKALRTQIAALQALLAH